jgi:hypothetical protein
MTVLRRRRLRVASARHAHQGPALVPEASFHSKALFIMVGAHKEPHEHE